MSTNAIPENQPIGTTIGTFGTVDQDSDNTFTYTLVNGNGSEGNSSFLIDSSGNLTSAVIFDHDTQATYTIRVRSTDQSGSSIEKIFIISIEAPPVITQLTVISTSEAFPELSGQITGRRTAGRFDSS